MKTLYVRIVSMTVFIVLLSAVLAFFCANFYYQSQLKSYNEEKLLSIADEVVNLFERQGTLGLESYLESIAHLNYQFYLYDEQGHTTKFGSAFRDVDLDPAIIRSVLSGQVYHGVRESEHGLFVTGFFENSIQNSIGVPARADGHTYALFMRPDIERMFGEVRILFAVLLVLTFVFSLLLVLWGTTYLVKPIRELTAATQKITEGDFAIRLEVSRTDEIGQLARHFTRMAGSLRQLDEMRQEFVSNVSHEIQSPLASIQGFSQVLRTEEMPAEERDGYLAIIEAESRRLSSLSRQLLTLASLDKEAHVSERSHFRLDEQIRHVILMLEWQWSEKQLEVSVELQPVSLTADANRMHQVWVNLLSNAIKFSHPGGSIAIRMHGDAPQGQVIVEIEDQGIGISETDLIQIFDRFYKADKARNRQGQGSGLGLAIAKKIVQQHGGQIEAQSQIGVGTTFRVYLPAM